MPGDEQKGKGFVWPVTATNEYRNMRGYQGCDLLDLLVVGDSFGPKQQAKTEGMACQDGSSKMFSMEVSSPCSLPLSCPGWGTRAGAGASEARTEQALIQYF